MRGEPCLPENIKPVLETQFSVRYSYLKLSVGSHMIYFQGHGNRFAISGPDGRQDGDRNL